MRCIASCGFVLTVLVTLTSNADDGRVLGKSAEGTPQLKSINVLGFAPDGVLLIGDGAGAQILAVATEDTKPQTGLATVVSDIDIRIAERIGTTPDGIEIVDVAVNPASARAYVAVRKQDDKQYVILTVDSKDEIDEFSLEDVTYARLPLRTDSKVVVNRVTDVAWADDRIVAAGRSNESFSSRIFSIDAPLQHDAAGNSYSAETYHVSHGRWETKAPMSVVIPFREDGKTWVVGAFSCTPVVKYPIDAIQPGAVVKGTSVIELGSGNRPIDMFVYEKNGKPFVLANTFRFHHERKPFGPSPYWTVKFEQGLLAEADAVDEKATRRLNGNYKPITERIQMVEAFHGVTHMDKLGDNRALVLRESNDGLSLEPLPLP